MTDNAEKYKQEKYKQAFGALHAPERISLEVDMKERKRDRRPTMALAVVVALAVALGGFGTAYALDAGGLRTTVQVWLAGQEAETVAEETAPGTYEFRELDENGEPGEVVAGGGGVAVQRDGTETPLSAQEVADLRAVGVEQRDGRVYLNYYDRTFDLTDLLAEDGTCRVSLQTDDGSLYFDIWDNGASWKNANPLFLGLYTAPD